MPIRPPSAAGWRSALRRATFLGLALALISPAIPAMAENPPETRKFFGTTQQQSADERAPLPADNPSKNFGAPEFPRPSMQVAPARECDPSRFTGTTGDALVGEIKAAPTDCINTLFGLSGADARGAFREEQMVTVANAYQQNAVDYPGDNSTSTAQLVLFLRAGYYVQYGDPESVGEYGPALKAAIQGALDAFFGNAKSGTVSDANGEVLAESVTLIDSSAENGRYLEVVKRLLTAYDSSYDQYWWMLNAVNNVYTVLFRGHQFPDFVDAVHADPSVLETLRTFASEHLDLLGTDNSFLTANAGRELARFVQHEGLRDQVRPMLKELLGKSDLTGPTAPLWVGIAEMADFYDGANCAEYGICDLQQRLIDAVLTVEHTCGPSIGIRAQQLSAEELAATCTSLTGQDQFFHEKVQSGGQPVADDHNTNIEVVVFDSSDDYRTYAGAIYGIDTNNGGMYLEGDPAQQGNQPRFIAHEAEWQPAFEIWNLNHEYTHYLDGRFNMHGDFAASMSTPTVWWIEGVGEYISYGYRGQPYPEAVEEAGKQTYRLSELWDTTYENGDTTRVYRWGYLAVRYMFERHPDELNTVLGHYRTGDWAGAREFLTSTIGTSYDADWSAWLTECAAGACSTP
ncbi:microbial collagenase [Saccharopolyspora antimicrobica]|uniref:microbial collagenase n=1 Tax=Saccharopolyspora antimicrobica TaxID=455193 RepID=A0A1I4S4R0_9PSEU|nr:collagenase [Saccharopolyspora antimicrobica]RKT87580.1 microbial collagenase [Saccharopolyspora antimicrobica]SFM59243.1 microbial collagenase [Saccharopolyspora antimicrobica]